MLGIGSDKDIAAMQAAEESNDGVQASIGLGLVDSLQALLELIVAVGSNEVGSHRALVHEVLERDIPVLLELDIVGEAHLYHFVDFRLKSEELSSKLDGVLQESLVLDDFLTSALDVGLHLLNDVLESALNSLEDPVHQAQLIEFAMLEH